MTDFDQSRLSNAGKAVAQDYKRFRKSTDRLLTVVDEARKSGLSRGQVEHAMLKFCSTVEEVVDCTTALQVREGHCP